MQAYTQSDLKRIFQLSASLVRSLARAGHIHPVALRGKVSYSFRDLLVLRTAAALRAAKVPAARIPTVLLRMREILPDGAAVSAVPLQSGGQIVLRTSGALWEPVTGQYALPLEPDAQSATVRALGFRRLPGTRAADDHFARAVALEAIDLDAAREAYAACLACDEQIAARINLGRLLHLQGRLEEAEAVYRRASESSAMLSFNLGVLLEDQRREAEAVASYCNALLLDPGLHDAHFNIARLYERADRPRDALRHLLAYKRSTAP